MSEIGKQTITAHYSTKTKVDKPNVKVALPPQNNINNSYFYNDREVSKKLISINNTIDNDIKKEKNKESNFFTKVLIGTALALTGFWGLKKIFKKS